MHSVYGLMYTPDGNLVMLPPHWHSCHSNLCRQINSPHIDGSILWIWRTFVRYFSQIWCLKSDVSWLPGRRSAHWTLLQWAVKIDSKSYGGGVAQSYDLLLIFCGLLIVSAILKIELLSKIDSYISTVKHACHFCFKWIPMTTWIVCNFH